MRKELLFNDDWIFVKKNTNPEKIFQEKGEMIVLPHTWNAVDGQDGGNDYYRGTCWYGKKFKKPEVDPNQQVYLEFRGANSTSEVWINGKKVTSHDGGYSTFRVNITNELLDENELVVSVDNSANRQVYPQKADFTFYGGIYRDVYLVIVPNSHFDMDYYGSSGLKITSSVKGEDAIVTCKAYITGEADSVRFIVEGIEQKVTSITGGVAEEDISIPNVRLWNGMEDPYLYTLKAELIKEGKIIDTVSSDFGCRTFEFDKDKGFFLNGKSYSLRGVSRHQDRRDVGNAISKEMMLEDMELIKEIGANTIRLAHYQHDQYFYDLCDKNGMIVWAEIPYITEHMPEGRQNTIDQLTELIAQNYNHPSIICWGLSNEITVTGITDDLIENHKILNDLAHRMDKSRPTALAHAFMLEVDDPFVFLSDIMSYNLYYGWYLGKLEHNDEFFDDFHQKYPDKVIGLAEYGADANPKYQSNSPERGDYSEQYQCVYHEHMLRMFKERPYLWSTHVWNMFDFGADGRDEGGSNGLNQKGLISFDRKYKKDAFYLYKAHWSKEPFVHICSKNYIERHEDETEIKVYTNYECVELYNNGALVERQVNNNIFKFNIKIEYINEIVVKAGSHRDEIKIVKVSEPNESYVLMGRRIKNWFDEPEMECPEGYYSIKDTMGEIRQNPEGEIIIEKMMTAVREKRGDVAKNVKQSESMIKFMNSMTIEELIKQAGGSITEDMVLEINKALNQVRKVS